jgi:hypothetical protein
VSPLTFFPNERTGSHAWGTDHFFSFAGNFSSLAEEADAGWDGAEANMAKAALMNGHLVFWVSGQSGQAGLHLRRLGDLIKIIREFSHFSFNEKGLNIYNDDEKLSPFVII